MKMNFEKLLIFTTLYCFFILALGAFLGMNGKDKDE